MLCYNMLQPNMLTVCIGALHAWCNFGTTPPVSKAKMEKISSSTSVDPTSTSLELEKKEEGIAMIVPSLLEHYSTFITNTTSISTIAHHYSYYYGKGPIGLSMQSGKTS